MATYRNRLGVWFDNVLSLLESDTSELAGKGITSELRLSCIRDLRDVLETAMPWAADGGEFEFPRPHWLLNAMHVKGHAWFCEWLSGTRMFEDIGMLCGEQVERYFANSGQGVSLHVSIVCRLGLVRPAVGSNVGTVG